VQLAPFTPDDAERWDELVERAPMATFLHTRRFLSYHGDRMRDASLVFTDERGALRAVLPAALDAADPTRVVSHPGATFGGLVHDGRLDAEGIRDALDSACAAYAGRGLSAFGYKPVPHIYHRSPSADDLWALADLGAARTGCALSVAIDLDGRLEPRERRVRSRRKALAAGLEVATDAALADFWPVLESTLERRYSTRPVHGLDEIELLQGRFPDAIRLVAGQLDGELVTGVVLFLTERVAHVQYMASSESGMRIGALDAVLEGCIDLAADRRARYFDFGTSMEDRGAKLQSGLHRFKWEFGGGGVVHEHYELPLRGNGGRA
jgi:hypothetical protein